MDEIYLTSRELSNRWCGKIKTKTLANWRSDPTGRGPTFRRFGNKVIYLLSAVEAYEQANEFSSLRRQARSTRHAHQQNANAGEVADPSAAHLRTESHRDELPEDIACVCARPTARHGSFERQPVGAGEIDGRYADVDLLRCRKCERLWVRCAVAYKGRSRSGRWARGLISEADATAITPESAAPYLARLPFYFAGGPYFSSQRGRRSGPMRWGP